MRLRLVTDVIIAFVFWWMLLSFGHLFSDSIYEWNISNLIDNLYISSISFFWGLLISSGIFVTLRTFSRAQLVGSELNGISVNIGSFPKLRIDLPRLKMKTQWNPFMKEWIANNSQKFPNHYKIICAIGEILEAHPLHPASIEPGGHGDRTLLDHSHYVAEFMIKGSSSFEYDGYTTRIGTKVEKIDPLYCFNNSDPLIPIVGLAHDIGKIICYEVSEEGVATEKRNNHDLRGALLLTSIPEFWDLPEGDRTILSDTVGYYHHSDSLPSNASDKSRAFIELVKKADAEAGEYEAKNPRMVSIEDTYDMVRLMLKARGEDPNKASLPDKNLPYISELAGVKLSLHQSRILYFFEELIFSEGVVNGIDSNNRLGFKIDDVIYFPEEPVRERLCKLLEAKRLVNLRKNDGYAVLTERLMEVLALRGSLINVVDGHEFGSGRALFKILARTTKQKQIKEYVWPAVFMVNANAYPFEKINKIPDIDLEVISKNPIYGWNQAKNKTKNSKPAQNIQLPAPDVIVVDSAVSDTQSTNNPLKNSAEGVVRELYEGGDKEWANGVQGTIDAVAALAVKEPKIKEKKRTTRRKSSESNNAASPVNTNAWWETDNGIKMINLFINMFRDSTPTLKFITIDDTIFGFMLLSQAMNLIEIPEAGIEKVISILMQEKRFKISKNNDDVYFLGISKLVLENP